MCHITANPMHRTFDNNFWTRLYCELVVVLIKIIYLCDELFKQMMRQVMRIPTVCDTFRQVIRILSSVLSCCLFIGQLEGHVAGNTSCFKTP